MKKDLNKMTLEDVIEYCNSLDEFEIKILIMIDGVENVIKELKEP